MKKFEVGQTWEMRSGKKVIIERTDFSDHYPIFARLTDGMDHVGGLTFTECGLYIDSDRTHALDLIKLVQTDEKNAVISAVGSVNKIAAPVEKLIERQFACKVIEELIKAGNSAKPKHEGGYGKNMVYITPEGYAVLHNVLTHLVHAPAEEEVRKVEIERDVFRAVLEGMGFGNLDEMVQRERAAYHARELGREILKIAQAIQVGLEKVSK